MARIVPLIYSPRFDESVVSYPGRLLALAISLACFVVYLTALLLPPNTAGISTHRALGLEPCQFLERTGLPCPACGMTTSYTHFVRGHFLGSLYVQPMGFVLAVLTGVTFWAALYIALTGRPAHRLLSRLNGLAWIIGLMLFGAAAWGWKIFIHVRGLDGWNG
jgi:hypothetical protein